MSANNAKKTTTASTKKIVDVKHEGDAASGTSRPVIVTNRPIARDPMMAEVDQLADAAVAETKSPTVSTDVPAEEETSEAAVPPSKKRLVIKPLEDTTETEAEPVATDTPTDQREAEQETAAEPIPAEDPSSSVPAKSDKATEEPKKATETDKPAPSPAVQPGRSFDDHDVTVADEDNKTVDDGKAKIEDAGAPSYQLTAEQQQAVEAGTYFLPITTAETRRLRRDIAIAVVGLLLLGVIWTDVMLDAGMIQLGGLHALTDFL